MNFVDKDGTTKMYIPVRPCISANTFFYKLSLRNPIKGCQRFIDTVFLSVFLIDQKKPFENVVKTPVYDHSFYGEGGGITVKNACSGVVGGSLRNLSKKHLNIRGGCRQKLFIGEGVLKVVATTPAPENFNCTPCHSNSALKR